ncbi:hypothetical protein ACG0Z6_11750 [Roseateles sp. BYS180W]|uniref:DUF4149 domain-containing protein n=1 Tax=Roseateles rivi TaxID=3299028 RepID=A0ABW7FX74_9BURK
MPTQFTHGIRLEVAQDVLGALLAHWTEVTGHNTRLLQKASSCGWAPMILVIRTVLFYALIWALTSFGFTVGALQTLLGQGNDISSEQLHAVAVTSAVATVVALALAVLLGLKLLGKGALAGRFPAVALRAIGLAFCAMAAYSFLVVAADHPEDFFRRFANAARYEFLLLGVAALALSVRRV